MIVFRNKNEMDIRSVTMLGMNSKPGNANPIGFFGSGLKYAICVLLREKQKIEIWSGLNKYTFRLKDMNFRDKAFQGIVMRGPDGVETDLSYTTEFGKNWTLAHAYRELWSNCKDEGGEVSEDRDADFWLTGGCETHYGESGFTAITVAGAEFAQVHDRAYGTILLPKDGKLLYEDEQGQVFLGASSKTYLRGIAALDMKTPSLFTYNLKSPNVGLTEDRSMAAGDWHLKQFVSDGVARNFSESLIEEILCAGNGYWEGTNIDLQYKTSASNAFCNAAARAIKTRLGQVNESASNLLFRVRDAKKAIVHDPVALSPQEADILQAAVDVLAGWNMRVDDISIMLVESLGPNSLAHAYISARQIVLTRKLLNDFELLVGTLIEEWLHIARNLADNSRPMQEALIGLVVKFGMERNALLQTPAVARTIYGEASLKGDLDIDIDDKGGIKVIILPPDIRPLNIPCNNTHIPPDEEDSIPF
jgi:hypothetical protein